MRDSIQKQLEIKHGSNGFTLVTVSAPGAPLTYKRADLDWAASGELGKTLVRETLSALGAHDDAQVAGLIWIQGEADTYAIARSDGYQKALSDLVEGWRNTVFEAVQNPSLLDANISVAQLSAYASGGIGRSNWLEVAAQQIAFGASDARVKTIRPDDIAATKGISSEEMFADGLHYSALFQPAFAEALIQALYLPVEEPDRGTDQNDVLRGTTGADVLWGENGDDTYIFNHINDRVVENADQGRDLVIALRDVNLARVSPHVEDALLAGAAPLNMKGNELGNHLTGNRGDNRIEGGAGADILLGAGGADRLIDRFGADRLVGGAGDDTYRLYASGSRITEEKNGGHDRVIASVDITLRFHSQELEDLTLLGRADLNGTGNGLSNQITGNRGANRLDGLGAMMF
ncbi:MAG: sialate O-acetylesterase [Arenibacterium sp.]